MSTLTKTRPKTDHTPYAERILITPDMAREFLDQNADNRPISKREVARLATIMAAGKWMLNGEPIKFDWNGKLRDGQHRLSALIESGAPVEMFVVSDLDPDTFSTMDQGRGRSTGDILAIADVPRAKATGLALATAYRIIKNRPIYGGVDKIPPFGALEILRRHPEITQSVEKCVPLYSDGDKPVSLGMLAAYHYIIGHVLETELVADNLINSLATGVDLDQDHPIRHFRKQILEHRSRKGMMHGQAKAAFLAKAVGLSLQGASVQRHLRKPSVRETYWSLMPMLEEAVAKLSPEEAMTDLPY